MNIKTTLDYNDKWRKAHFKIRKSLKRRIDNSSENIVKSTDYKLHSLFNGFPYDSPSVTLL